MGLKHKEEEEEEGRGEERMSDAAAYFSPLWKRGLEHQISNFVFEGRLVIKAGENILRGGDSETDRQFRYNFFGFFVFVLGF